jgi:hypothetical protein
VRDRAHVGLVDAHPERVGGDDDLCLAGHEARLRGRPPVAREAGVVGQRLDPQLAAEVGRQALGLRAGARVDDRRPRSGLGERRDEPSALVGGATAGHHREAQVRAVEAGGHPDRVAEAEPRHDVGGHLGRRRRGRRHDRLRPEPARRVGEAKVVGPEVVAPLGDAVRLVDDEQAQAHVAQRLEEPRRREALGRDVQQPQLARSGALDGGAVGGRILLRVDERRAAGRDAPERLDLILHERHQRGDHERQVFAHEGGQLVAERLARAGGHDDEDVARRARAGHGGDRLGLAAAELLEAEVLAQRAAGIVHRLPT